MEEAFGNHRLLHNTYYITSVNIADFISNFPGEQECRNYLKIKREELGVVCSKCNHTKHYWLSSVGQWKCEKCHARTSLRTNTIMQNSKLPIRDWLIATHLITTFNQDFSIVEVQRYLKYKRYDTVWNMVQKIKNAFYRQSNYVNQINKPMQNGHKLDWASWDFHTNVEDNTPAYNSIPIMLLVEENEEQQQTRQTTHAKESIRMVIMDKITAKEMNFNVNTNPLTANSNTYENGYNKLTKLIEQKAFKVAVSKTDKMLSWMKTNMASSKRLLLGVEKSVGQKCLQKYLHEFCYSFNGLKSEEDFLQIILRKDL